MGQNKLFLRFPDRYFVGTHRRPTLSEQKQKRYGSGEKGKLEEGMGGETAVRI